MCVCVCGTREVCMYTHINICSSMELGRVEGSDGLPVFPEQVGFSALLHTHTSHSGDPGLKQ